MDHSDCGTDHEEKGESSDINIDGGLDMDPGVIVLGTEVQTDSDHDDVSQLRSSSNDALQQVHQLIEQVNHLTPQRKQ